MVGLMILSAGCRVFQGWGRSSAGRAPALQAGGHRFDPDRLHHRRFGQKWRGCRCLNPHRGDAAAIVCLQTMRAAPRIVRFEERRRGKLTWCVSRKVRIRCDHVRGQSVLRRVVMPLKWSPHGHRWAVALVLWKCESGSGASLGACDRHRSVVFGPLGW
jgi:hypothetical protein